MRRLLSLFALTLYAHAQWALQDSGTTASLRGIHAVSPQIAWASGTEGTVLHTTDGGAHWLRCATPPDADKLDFRGIQAFDANTAIVMSSGKGDLSRLYKTTDGCKKWRLLTKNKDKDGFWDSFIFRFPYEGVLLGDPVKGSFYLARTGDGGHTWKRQKNRALLTHGDQIAAFAASNASMITLGTFGGVIFGSGGAAGARIFNEREISICLDACPENELNLDGAKNKWSVVSIPVGDGSDASGVFALSYGGFGLFWVDTAKRRLVAVGGNYLQPDNSGRTAAWSADNAMTWSPAATPPHGYRSAVAYSPTYKLWITVGPNGTDISRDDGKNWSALKPVAGDAPDADQHWNALSLPFVVGSHGRIGLLEPAALKPSPLTPNP